MARESSLGASLIVAACVLAISVVTGSFLIKRSIDDGTQRLDQVLGELKSVSGQLAAAPRAGAPSARPARPDPARKYDVAAGDAPTRGGPDTAKIRIVEWSDFQ